MRISILLASAAALSLAACGNSPVSGGNPGSSASADSGQQVDDKSLEDQVMAALDDAPRNGLTKDLFLKGDLPSDQGQRRQQLLKIATDYASALANGKVDPNSLHDVYTVSRPKDVADGQVQQALAQNKYREWVSSLAPQTKEYQALSDAFVKLVQRSPNLPNQDIPAGGVIHKGDSDKRVPLIAKNLEAQGYLPTGEQQGGAQTKGLSGNTFTPAMSQALARFQADAGLKSDGVVGPNTVEALNQGPRDRARTLAVAMERLRWLNRNPPATRIDVNTADSMLTYYRDGQQVDRRKVVTGQPGWETPQLGTQMYALVANPNWVVPDSIAKKDDFASKSQSWLRDNNFTKKNGHWVQQPGPDSALGVVKFALKDDQAIYLHDTPAKSLFQQADRHDSHGCVRVHNALQFAHSLATQEGIDDKFTKAMASKDETPIHLPNEIPVRLIYHTAYLGDDGRIHYAKDVYGWDNAVASALGYEKKQQAQTKGHAGGDLGP